MHAVDTLITPDSSTASPEQGQVTPARSQGGEQEWSHTANMGGWVKVREQLCAGAGWYACPQESL